MYPQHQWTAVNHAQSIVIIEGWCVGIEAQTDDLLLTPVNQLEKNLDPNGRWRAYSNQQLHEDYKTLFNKIDFLVMLKAPSFKQIYAWRCEQEQRFEGQVWWKKESLLMH